MQHSDVSEWSHSVEDAALYKRYGQTIFTYVYRQVACLQDAEDIVVEVFLAAFKQNALLGLTSGQQIAWLRRVARNKVIDGYRRHSHTQGVPLEEVRDMIDEQEKSLEQSMIQKEAYERLHKAVISLSPVQQLVIRLRFGEDLRYAEIAEIVNQSESSVRKLVTRTLRRLHTMYQQMEKGADDVTSRR